MSLYICDEISIKTTEEVLRGLHEGSLTTIYLCSPGGDLAAAFGIYDAILGKGIEIKCYGSVQSSALAVLLGGDKRYAGPNTRFMSHQISIEGETISEDDIAEMCVYTEMLAKLYSSRTKLSIEKAREMLDGEHTFGVKEAKSMGFIHAVMDGK